MKILHVSPHYGGGVGTVVLNWADKENRIAGKDEHWLFSLDRVSDHTRRMADKLGVPLSDRFEHNELGALNYAVEHSDIVVTHWWDSPLLEGFQVPPCRLAFWCHKNYDVPGQVISYPDRFFDTSPVQGHGAHIWSTGGVDRFLEIQPKSHEGFNIGYVGTVDYKKLHPKFPQMCWRIYTTIPNVHFTIVGENNLPAHEFMTDKDLFTFTGPVDDVAPYLAEMDVFGYPLRPDHYGTCEQALGEAMAAGVVPVVMDNPAERVIIQDGVNGLLALGEQDYVWLVEFLYKRAHTREAMSLLARDYAKTLYSIDTMIGAWDRVFASMMTEPKRERGRW